MGRVTAQQPTLTAAERDWLTWARSVPASAREAARYRQPTFGGARAAPKAQVEARELYDAQQALTKARKPRVAHACVRALRLSQAVVCAGDGGASPRPGDLLLLHLTLRAGDERERLLSSTRLAEGGRDVPLRCLLGDACTLLRGVELALAAFTRGERAVLRLPPDFAYGARRARLTRRLGLGELTQLHRGWRRPRHELGARPGAAARRVRQAGGVRGG